MLKDDVEQMEEYPEQVEEKEAVCRFCGQYRKVKSIKGWGMQELDEIGTELCDCSEAQTYTERKHRKERALSKAEKMFGQSSRHPVKDSVLHMVYEAIELADKEEVKKVAIEIEKGLKAGIQLTSKGAVKVERSMTEKTVFEE